MAEKNELANDLALVNNYKKVAREYGLFSEKVQLTPPGGATKEYLVFSLSPIKDNINPVYIINRNKRNPNLFYPQNFAVEMNGENPLLIWENISSYLAYAEFMCELYEKFKTPIPKAIRTDELEALSAFCSNATNPEFDKETRKEYMDGLQEFFKTQNPKNKFKKEFMEFYRSELFDRDKSRRQNLRAFRKRNEPETTIKTLIDSSGELKKVYMPEHDYKKFREIIKERFPSVKYSVSEKRVIDEGIIIDPASGDRVKTPYGITVTEEEYDKVMEKSFAKEGNACLADLTPSYFEGRDVIYKASDENIIASVSREVTLGWAKCSDLATLQKAGPLNSVEVPAGHLMNFYVAMKNHNVPIYIDYDVNSAPNFKTVRVVYNEIHERTVHNILVGLAMAQVNLAHISLNNKKVTFDIDIDNVDRLIHQAKNRLESQNRTSRTLPSANKQMDNV